MCLLTLIVLIVHLGHMPPPVLGADHGGVELTLGNVDIAHFDIVTKGAPDAAERLLAD